MFSIGDRMFSKEDRMFSSKLSFSSTTSVALDSVLSPQGCALIFVSNLLPLFPSSPFPSHSVAWEAMGLGHTAAAGATSQGTQGHPTQCPALPSVTSIHPPIQQNPSHVTTPFLFKPNILFLLAQLYE